MKKKLVHFASVGILTVVLGFTVKTAFAQTPPEVPKKVVDDTICCKKGSRAGTSNDCIRGNGECVDNTCPTGTTESAYLQGCLEL